MNEIIEYRRAKLAEMIAFVVAHPDEPIPMFGVEGTRMLLKTFEHDVEAAQRIYEAVELSPTWTGAATIRMFKEGGETVYVRLVPGGTQFGTRITADEAFRLDRDARLKKSE